MELKFDSNWMPFGPSDVDTLLDLSKVGMESSEEGTVVMADVNAMVEDRGEFDDFFDFSYDPSKPSTIPTEELFSFDMEG
jgi:hypothetical protein